MVLGRQRFYPGCVSERRSKSWAHLGKCDNARSWGVSLDGKKGSQKGRNKEGPGQAGSWEPGSWTERSF